LVVELQSSPEDSSVKYVSQGEAAAPNAVINDNPQRQTGKPFMLDFFFLFPSSFPLLLLLPYFS